MRLLFIVLTMLIGLPLWNIACGSKPPQPVKPSTIAAPSPVPRFPPLATPSPSPSPEAEVAVPASTGAGNGVVFLDDATYPDTTGNLHIVGEVRNDTESNVKQVKITVSLLDTQGKPVATRANLSYLSLLEPGQRSPFDVIFQKVSGGIPKYQMELSWEATAEEPKTRMQVLQTSARNDGKGHYWVEGEVRNVGSQGADEVAIVGSFYDDSVKIVAVAFGFPDIVPLAPGDSSPFSMPVEIPKGMTISESVVWAEAY